jgi:hypothetical protein
LHSFFCNGNISAPWVKFAKDILDNCGLSNVWAFQNINFNTECHTFDKPQLSNISFANFTQGADIFPLQKKLCKSL